MSPLWIEIIKGLFTVVAAAVAAGVAFWMYFRQKEYELIKQRYLEGAVDVIAGELESILGVAHHNWARSLQIVKTFRDNAEHFDSAELGKGFLDIQTTKFHRVAHHRLRTLTNTDAFWTAYQLAVSYATVVNSLAVNEIPEAIRVWKTAPGAIKQTAAEVARLAFERLKQEDDKGSKFAILLRELYQIGRLLETERLKFKGIVNFHAKPDVVASVQRLKAEFDEYVQTVMTGRSSGALEAA
jgi:hypothetical protein